MASATHRPHDGEDNFARIAKSYSPLCGQDSAYEERQILCLRMVGRSPPSPTRAQPPCKHTTRQRPARRPLRNASRGCCSPLLKLHRPSVRILGNGASSAKLRRLPHAGRKLSGRNDDRDSSCRCRARRRIACQVLGQARRRAHLDRSFPLSASIGSASWRRRAVRRELSQRRSARPRRIVRDLLSTVDRPSNKVRSDPALPASHPERHPPQRDSVAARRRTASLRAIRDTTSDWKISRSSRRRSD